MSGNDKKTKKKQKTNCTKYLYCEKARKSYSSVGSSPSSLLFIVTDDPECILEDSAISGSFSSKSV